ncbi:MAG TPA: hypothetical protein VFE57_08940 [Cyclobacteriaceae bacterium]|nr:hypothetical protein [Cyclobacteriaceae bacterium]
MKTLKTVLILIIMLSGRLSFGSGNETCCPDTTNASIVASNSQMQLDLLQSESYEVQVAVPSLHNLVMKKLERNEQLLNQVQEESERMDAQQFSSFPKLVEFRLNSRLLELNDEDVRQTIKL